MGPLCRALITAGLLAPLCRGFAQTTASLDYCRSTVPPGHTLPEIPVGQQGRDEQDPQRDELSLSLAWVTASESFAELARLTEHSSLTSDAKRRSHAARDAIRPAYYDPRKQQWASGHLRSGAPVEGLTGSLIALSHHGLLGEQEQSALLDALASPRYRTLWGIRSTPNDSPLYDPDAYARGSVWALGTADAITAFYEAGRAATATALWRDLVPWFGLDSPGHMHEVLNGDAFVPERESVPDQTWSSAAFVSSGVRGLLGLHVDASNRRLTFTPRIPADWDSLRVRHIALAGTELGLALRTSSDRVELEIENPGPAMTLTFRPPLQSGVHVRSADPSDGVRLTSAVTDEIHVICPANRTGRVVLQLAPAR